MSYYFLSSSLRFYSVFIVVYVSYYFTLYPSIAGGDSGELLAESCQLGTAHPPGYPLFTILAKLTSLVPIPRININTNNALTNMLSIDYHPFIAWKINHLCCIFGAFTASFIYATINEILETNGISDMNIIASLAAFMYAWTPLVWEYSTTAEVFALNNILCSIMIYLTIHSFNLLRLNSYYGYKVKPSTSHNNNNEQQILLLNNQWKVLRCIGNGGLCVGLALSNQHSSLIQIAYLVSSILIFAYYKTNFIFMLNIIMVSIIGFLIGFSTYLYLLYASNRPTIGSWGNQNTFSGFVTHLLRSEYGTFRLGMIEGSETGLQRIVIYLKHTSKESFHCIFVILLSTCLLYTWRDYIIPILHKNDNSKYSVYNISNIKKLASNNTKKEKKNNKNTNDGSLLQQDIGAIKNKHNINNTTITNDNTDNTDNNSDRFKLPIYLIIGLWLFYIIIWHSILSNLPISSSAMAFAVHARFWMQPNIALYIILGVSIGYISCFIRTTLKNVYGIFQSNKKNHEVFYNLQVYYSNQMMQLSILIVSISTILYHNYPLFDKSKTGHVMHLYGKLTLDSLPTQSLLLSHTDLDWNTVRYLQLCESIRTDITHLNFQLMPYPWFPNKQSPLYPQINFPNTNFVGVSTDRKSEGNAMLIIRFLQANKIQKENFKLTNKYIDQYNKTFINMPILQSNNKNFPGGVYLDFQAVNEAEIGTNGFWKGFSLVPWGNVYRIFKGSLTINQIQTLHHYSLQILHQMKQQFPIINKSFVDQFYDGSWERAAASVFYDAHYQLGLSLLTYGIELQTKIELKLIPILLDRFYISSLLLKETQDAAIRYKTFSSSISDLDKNVALSWMRLQSLLEISLKYKHEINQVLYRYHNSALTLEEKLLDANNISWLLNEGSELEVKNETKRIINLFIKKYPMDLDILIFKTFINK